MKIQSIYVIILLIAFSVIPSMSFADDLERIKVVSDEDYEVMMLERESQLKKIDAVNKIAIIKTDFGDMYFFLFESSAPNHVRNFIDLAERGFYKGVKFHRIKPDFVAQAGEPREDWTEEVPPLVLEVDQSGTAKHRVGALAAARTKYPNSATSQFYIALNETNCKHLDSSYTVYGQVFRGFDVVDKFAQIKVGPNPQLRGENSIPLEDVFIKDVIIKDAKPYIAEINLWKLVNGIIKDATTEPEKPSGGAGSFRYSRFGKS